jgi:hypothetical protein
VGVSTYKCRGSILAVLHQLDFAPWVSQFPSNFVCIRGFPGTAYIVGIIKREEFYSGKQLKKLDILLYSDPLTWIGSAGVNELWKLLVSGNGNAWVLFVCTVLL